MAARASDHGGADTRERIAIAALKVATRARHRRLPVVDICDEAGVARGTFYRYFSGPGDLYPAMASAVATAVSAELERALARDRSSPANPLRVVADVFARVFVEESPLSGLFRTRPALALELAAAASADIAAALEAHVCSHAGYDRCSCADDAVALVRVASALALAPRPGDRQLLRRTVGAWMADGDVAATPRAS
ncbi:MAG: hypothetical protein QOJ03_1891 [Frankiaceae bacterium]|jgi:AcrR family transcriptional regulator|nr:hypothetical protein [Frankiaceae bacterium]